jgi:2-polyprenyl-3-methyl-5-hydroxy-6-metoxy-1,4-benzoquinol methylase
MISKDLFKSFQAVYYDKVYQEKNYSEEVAFINSSIENFLRSESTKISLLDMGCGTGNHASKLASDRIQVTGIDISAEMINLAINKQANLNSNPNYVVANLLDFEIDTQFDVICIMFNVIGYLENFNLLSTLLNRISENLLKPGGILIFDFWDIEGMQIESPPKKELKWEIDGHQVSRSSRSSLDTIAKKLHIEFKWEVKDTLNNSGVIQVHQEIHSILFYDRHKIATILESNNFDVVLNLFAPSFLDRRSCLIVARKLL